ncbi:MAG: response regulator receiver protein [Variovorax sp.]|nr:response regulator receiver protein [Variovorax sp.]
MTGSRGSSKGGQKDFAEEEGAFDALKADEQLHPVMRVLLVEDEPATAQQMRHLLRAIDGAQLVFEARTEPEATQWIDANPYGWDLALVDVFLARGHGFRVVQHCHRHGPLQKVALMSMYTRAPIRERALAAGADAFFDKALEMPALIDFCVDLRNALRVRGGSYS